MLLSFSVIDWLIDFIFCIDLVIDSYWYNFIFSFNRCSRRKNGCWGVSSCTLSTTPPCSSTGSNLLFSLHLSQVWYFFLGLFTRVTYPILFLFLRIKLRTSFSFAVTSVASVLFGIFPCLRVKLGLSFFCWLQGQATFCFYISFGLPLIFAFLL